MQSPDQQPEQPAADYLSAANDFKPTPMPATPPEAGFGARIKAARTHYSLNIEALSRLTKACDQPEGRGVSGAAIARYEANEALPGAREFRLLAECMGLSADWLLFGTIQTGGRSAAQQNLIAALLAVIAEQKDDFSVHGAPVSEWSQSNEQGERRKRIAEARRPG